MLFSDPNNRGTGRLTKAEQQELGSELASQGHNPTKEVSAVAVLDALLMRAAKQHDAKHPGSAQTHAAQNFINRR